MRRYSFMCLAKARICGRNSPKHVSHISNNSITLCCNKSRWIMHSKSFPPRNPAHWATTLILRLTSFLNNPDLKNNKSITLNARRRTTTDLLDRSRRRYRQASIVLCPSLLQSDLRANIESGVTRHAVLKSVSPAGAFVAFCTSLMRDMTCQRKNFHDEQQHVVLIEYKTSTQRSWYCYSLKIIEVV